MIVQIMKKNYVQKAHSRPIMCILGKHETHMKVQKDLTCDLDVSLMELISLKHTRFVSTVNKSYS